MPVDIFRHTHRVTYSECTLGDHVYYARFLDILEAARGEFFRQLGVPFTTWQQRDTQFPVVECRLHYHAPARYDDLLSVELWPTVAERIRLNFSHRVLNPTGVLILEAETLHVCTGLNGKPRRLPEDLVAKLQPCLRGSDGTNHG